MAAAAAAADEFRLVSPAIHHEGRLPRKYTDDGQGALKNISPPLEWYNVPEGTKSLALVVQDVDDDHVVPWVIWIVINIPPTLKGKEFYLYYFYFLLSRVFKISMI